MLSDVEAIPESPTHPSGSMQVALSSSSRNELVGFGVVIEKQLPRYRKVNLKARTQQNPFFAELAAMAHTLNTPVGLGNHRITLLTSNEAAALTVKNPR